MDLAEVSSSMISLRGDSCIKGSSRFLDVIDDEGSLDKLGVVLSATAVGGCMLSLGGAITELSEGDVATTPGSTLKGTAATPCIGPSPVDNGL